jgi:hypothetical protein
MRKKRQVTLSASFLVLHGNARRHIVAYTRDTLQGLKSRVPRHPACNPDIAPLEFHLFRPLKGAIGGSRFAEDGDMKVASHSAHGIKKLMDD